jgi:Na+-translocating ferredoxin:NAD+ oxidoreductase RnfC subunit
MNTGEHEEGQSTCLKRKKGNSTQALEEPHANQEPSRENDVIIDLSSRDEVVEAIKYLKDNKAAGSDSIALKSGRPSLVNTLKEMIQQVWIGERYCVQCTRRAINLTARIIAASAYLM